MTPTEYTEVERPRIEILRSLGCTYLPAEDAKMQREGLNQVVLRDTLVNALMRIDGIDEMTARAIDIDLANLSDNEAWTKVMRGNYSRTVEGEEKHRTMKKGLMQDLLTGRVWVKV